MSHLRQFGCKVLLLDKSPGKGKQDPRTTEGTFIGYAETSKGYRVWIPKDRKMVVTRDIKFLDRFHATDDHNNLISEISSGREDMPLDDDNCALRGLPAEIACSDESITHQPPDGPADDIVDVVPEQREDEVDPPNDDGTGVSKEPPPAHGPGRPRKVLTRKPGRPAKQFHPKRATTQLDSSTTVERHPESEDEGDASLICYDAQLAMIASEIPFFQAVSGPDSNEWRDAIYAEIKSLVGNETWTLVDRPSGEKVIGCRTVLRNKYKADGKLERRKARVVAKGFSQRPGVDFHDTFAPVARIGSLRTLVAIAVEQDMEIAQIDVTTAYLNGTMDTTVYIEKPDMLQEMLERIISTERDTELIARADEMLSTLKEGDKVCRLNKSLYGLRQAGRRWHARLDVVLRELG